MTDDLSALLGARGPTADRPFQGLTILIVEDSRFACEAFRLLGMRSGARIRRADCLRSARRHLQTYRPTAVIVDLGLPDGPGLDLIAELAHAPVRVPAVLGTSGDPALADAALGAGADGFLPKPVESLSAFRTAILNAIPGLAPGASAMTAEGDGVEPDTLALRDDLAEAARLLGGGDPDEGVLDYVSQFLSGIARGAHDAPLERAATDWAVYRRSGAGAAAHRAKLSGLVEERLRAGAGF